MAQREEKSERPLWSKFLWFAVLWSAGVGTVTIVALIIRKSLGL
jgi:hypothetical protein